MRENLVENADLRFVKPVCIAQEKIGNTAQQFDPAFRRAVLQSVLQLRHQCEGKFHVTALAGKPLTSA
jgi:hypothetical protein